MEVFQRGIFIIIFVLGLCVLKSYAYKVSASSGEDFYSPEKAVDKDFNTRWTSDFKDNQYWQIEFPNEKNLCGIKIHWEAAFGEKYSIEVADQKGEFKNVYQTDLGDGKTDIIFFKPSRVKKLRFNGIYRGTGWGFSFWEMDFIESEKYPLISSQNQEKNVKKILDGNKNSSWTCKEDKSSIIVELLDSMNLGGMQIYWGDSYALSYNIEISQDKKTWQKVYQQQNGKGKTEWLYFKTEMIKYLRISLLKSIKKGYSIKEIEFKSHEESPVPIKFFQLSARNARQGLYPLWLKRIQEYWTIIGKESGPDESLFSENGLFEPYRGGYTIIPFIQIDRQLYTYHDCKVSQHLMKGFLPLPQVRWKHRGFLFQVQPLPVKENSDSYTMIQYKIANRSKKKISGNIILAILPVQLNPIWHNGGLGPIERIDFVQFQLYQNIRINNKIQNISFPKADQIGAVKLDQGDIISYIKQNKKFPQYKITDHHKAGSCVLYYTFDLEKDQKKDIFLSNTDSYAKSLNIPDIRNPEAYFLKKRDEYIKYWNRKLNRIKINVPDKKLIDVFKSNIAYIFINKDGPFFKPGSRNYDHSWLRDSALTSIALLRTGYITPVRDWIKAVSKHIYDNGMVPHIFLYQGEPSQYNFKDLTGEGKEYDSLGQYLFAVRQYYDYSKDRDLIKKIYPKLYKVCQYIKELRKQRMTKEYLSLKKNFYYGLLPQSNSHEGYFPAMHSYWDNYWGIRGLQDMLYLSEMLKKKRDVLWIKKELSGFKQCLKISIEAVMKKYALSYIPGCVEKKEFDPLSTSIIRLLFPQNFLLKESDFNNTMNRYYSQFKRRIKTQKKKDFLPYEFRIVEALFRSRQRNKGIDVFKYLVKHSIRPKAWNQMAEVVYLDARVPSYVGDMPHTWVGSGYINAVRSMFVFEENEKIILGAGIDTDWFKQDISISNLPTLYGDITYKINKEKEDYMIYLTGKAKPRKGFSFWLPKTFWNYTIQLNKNKKKIKKGEVIFNKLPAVIKIKKK